MAEEEPPFGFLGPLPAICDRSPLLPSLSYGLYTFVTASWPCPQLFFCSSALMLNGNARRLSELHPGGTGVRFGYRGSSAPLPAGMPLAQSTQSTAARRAHRGRRVDGQHGAPPALLCTAGAAAVLSFLFLPFCCSVSTAPSALWLRKRKEVPHGSISSPPAPLLPAHSSSAVSSALFFYL